ncbi:uncharacterized protein LOC111394218 [Olea europaea var. sylvestris]|uniref:uncharacterized protein LOC111394218 n=1 Tax=Olea europaea var. sylvestris TaxID=158386 RepID=UPI000C1CFB1A|nr:uncharacterized protein LOC111394218 [Olea europaea var. sylvestris]
MNQRGTEANLEKKKALFEMKSLQKPKEVQSLNGRIAALSRFISKVTDKSLPFFKILKQGRKFQWTEKCEAAFQALKKHLEEAPLLSKSKSRETLLLYLAVSDEAISVVLAKEEEAHQLPVYYISKALLPAETLYPDMEMLALFHVTASRKLRPYFQAHSIKVLTNFPLKQAFADFIAKFAKALEMEATMDPAEPPTWKLFVDGSLGKSGSRAKVVLESPEGHMLNCAIKFGFKASNNAAESKALLVGLKLAKEMKVERLQASSNSQLVVSHVNGKFTTKSNGIVPYLKLVLNLVPYFKRFELVQVPHLENTHADALSKLASSKDSELLKIVPIENLPKPSIFGGKEVMWIEGNPPWMQPIIAYLKDQSLPPSKNEAKKLRRRAAHFILQNGVLYKRGFSSPLLRCIGGEETLYVLKEIHEEVCGNHSGRVALAHKVFRQGYFWPT